MAMAEWAAGNHTGPLALLGPMIDDNAKDRLYSQQVRDTLFGGIEDHFKR